MSLDLKKFNEEAVENNLMKKYIIEINKIIIDSKIKRIWVSTATLNKSN
jgi:hypothetical protein